MKSNGLLAASSLLFLCSTSWTTTITAADGATADPASGRSKAVLCVGCHGMNGEGRHPASDQPAYPSLAGQIPGYFIKSIHDYKHDRRNEPLMNALSKGLTDSDIANLAAYYASLK